MGMVLFIMNALHGEEPHAFSVHDMLAMDRISEPQISPDGKQIVFTLRRTDLKANRGRKDIWLINQNGSDLRQLTQHEADDYNPVWSRDGKAVYFLSSRSEYVQVWRIDIQDAKVTQITDFRLDIGILKLSPDGRTFCLSLEVFPDMSVEETVRTLNERKESQSSGILYDRLLIRHWDTWKDGRRSHLFVLPAEGGDPVDVMNAMDADCPTKPWGGSEEVAFTPDCRGLIFTAKDMGRQEAWSTDFDLFYAPLDATRPPRKITENPAWDTQPAFSHDGNTLACLSMKVPGYESDRYRIVLRPWGKNGPGKARWLTESWDRSPRSIVWSGDGKTIYAHADDLGQRSLFAVNVKSGTVKKMFSSGTVRFPQMAEKSILFGLDHLRSPVELYILDPGERKPKQITEINQRHLNVVKMGEPEQFIFSGWNGETVYAYIVKPVDFDYEKKYPVAFLIHGGPHGSFGNDFHYRWNPQVYAGAGYAVIMIDFHGSEGYGQKFQDANRNDWGGKPLIDLQKGLEAVLKKYSWLDGDRVAALGASYGGYMINWIAGNWPERFRCLVNHDGNLDERMAYFDTEELWFPEWEHIGTPWEKPDHFERQNPVNYVKNWKTPMLVIHGQKDYRLPVSQGIAAFNVLQRKGIPSWFLYFPDENHWVLKPHNSIQWHETVLEWLDRWCRQDRIGK
ncbi:S9 family peptidase [bacterium]|nr:S9 family peptidase [bacterium]